MMIQPGLGPANFAAQFDALVGSDTNKASDQIEMLAGTTLIGTYQQGASILRQQLNEMQKSLEGR